MNPAMESTLKTFELGNALFVNGVATLDEATAHRPIVDNANPVIWLAGHLLNCRKYLLELFGESYELSWESSFLEKYDPASAYPSMSELAGAWTEISNTLSSKIREASEEDFSRAVDWNLPNEDKTVRGALLFYVYHEAWHLGQIAYARKGMGMEGLVPY